MRVLIRGLALLALGTAAPAFAQMSMTPPPDQQAPQKQTDQQQPGQQEDQPAMAPTHKTTAPIKLPQSKIAPEVPLNPRERAVQLLNRFTYGPRPGDVERVLAMGPDAWFAQQLNPNSIHDDALTRRLQDYATLNLTPEELLYTIGAMSIPVNLGRRPFPADPLLASLYEVESYKINEPQAAGEAYKKAQIFDQPPTDAVLAARLKAQTDHETQAAEQRKADQIAAARIAGQLLGMPKNQRIPALVAMPPADRIAFANFCPPELRDMLFADMTGRERDYILAMRGGGGAMFDVVYNDLSQAKLLRSILSERQLQEVMTDFWFNHFNVFQPKDSDVWYTTSYERDAIRANALGKFRDLLLATAETPAMMVYLDNWLSVGPNSVANGATPGNPNGRKNGRGLNENYGREVMELHTVGVHGGYTQEDVTHLAAILTGWTIERPSTAGPFLFNAKLHEPGAKHWFGYTIDDQGKVLTGPAGKPLPVIRFPADVPDGMKQGYAALSILADSPQAAHFISWLIAQRFVADDPPAALVDRMAATYLSSDTDIKAVLKTLISSPEFNSHRYFRNKVKTPMEFVASAFRATGTDPQNPGALVTMLKRDLGEPLYQALPPTGYYITADQWMNTQSLLARLNFADQLTHNRFANQKFDSLHVLALSLLNDSAVGLPPEATDPRPARPHAMPVSATEPTLSSGSEIAQHVLESVLIEGEISPNTDRFIHSQMAEQPPNSLDALNLLTALLIGSPEFQLR